MAKHPTTSSLARMYRKQIRWYTREIKEEKKRNLLPRQLPTCLPLSIRSKPGKAVGVVRAEENILIDRISPHGDVEGTTIESLKIGDIELLFNPIPMSCFKLPNAKIKFPASYKKDITVVVNNPHRDFSVHLIFIYIKEITREELKKEQEKEIQNLRKLRSECKELLRKSR